MLATWGPLPFADQAQALDAADTQNRRTEAVRRFDQFTRRLDRELGMEPEPETRRLVEQLKGKR